MKASVLIPYGYQNVHQHRLLRFTIDRWREFFPEFEIIIGDSAKPFNRSAARNHAASDATTDTFVFCDADTVFMSAPVVEAAQSICDGSIWFGSDNYFVASRDLTNGILGGDLTVEAAGMAPPGIERVYRNQPGGMLVCHRSQFEEVGGFDSGFLGWGYEDTAFVEAMTCLFGQRGHLGDVLHLHHDKSHERQAKPQISINKRRHASYVQAARRGPDGMQALLVELGVKK